VRRGLGGTKEGTVRAGDYNFFISTLRKDRRGWEDSIKMDIPEVGCGGMDWIVHQVGN